ncbi:MAG: hypothetical protein ACFE75_05310 [Candidatus Hodarchaeota archaeon]
MDIKLFKKTFKFICDECGKFAHTEREYCEKCGAQALRKATKDDYIKYESEAMKKAKENKNTVVKARKESQKARKIFEKTEKAEIKAGKLVEKSEKKAGKVAEKAEKTKQESKEI